VQQVLFSPQPGFIHSVTRFDYGDLNSVQSGADREGNAMWTKDVLLSLVESRLAEQRLIVVANREPYIHRWAGDHIECIQPASGMATALDPVMRACGGVWVSHGGGDADGETVDEHDHVPVPPDAPEYTLRRVWLSKEQEERYYYGLSNDALWPLCHAAFRRPEFRQQDWDAYRQVNEIFAKAVIEEASDRPALVFIQDYHLALLPRLLKSARPDLVVAQFWHIPWPNRETFRAFPWKEELLDGLLGNDLLGFHLRYHCQNFLDTIDRALEARVDQEHSDIVRNGKRTLIRPFPISIDVEEHMTEAASDEVQNRITAWRQELGLRDEILAIGIDRLDYTKGIPDRLRALDRLFEKHPEYLKRLVFVQIGVPSRSHLRQYQLVEDEIDDCVEKINWRWRSGSWRPIILLKKHQRMADMIALHRLAQVCVVSSLHDGMNLVAKEYVASRIDSDGVLILSQFTGAARELVDALIVNPFDREQMADALHAAIVMPESERQRRMAKMRFAVAGNSIYRWIGKILIALLRIDIPGESPERAATTSFDSAVV
jgi:alpha,alpha-trehalose-phosphate synthase [UDP-forming]